MSEAVFYVYGFLIVKLSPRAPTAKIRSIANGAVQLPVEINKELLKVAINDATIKLKFVRL